MSTTEEPEPMVQEPETTEPAEHAEQPENPEEPTAGTSGTGSKLDEEYGDIHKIVLQGLLAAGFLDTKGVKKLFIGACTYLKLDHTERTTMPYVQRIVREINERVKPYDMLIKSASCEFTGRKFYIFLITVENPIFKMQTLFSKFELELYQKCMDAIMRRYNNYSVPLTECMNFAKDCEAKGSVQEAETFILRMIRAKYLAKYMLSPTEFQITMGFRGLREFEPMLKELYNDTVSNCKLCKMVLLHGLLCPNCRTLVHKHCFLKFIRTSKECPHCKIPWTKPGVKEEPIEMIRRLRDTSAGETDPSIQASVQFDAHHVSGDEEEARGNPPVEGAVVGVGVTTGAQAQNVKQPQTVEAEEEEEGEEDEEEVEDDDEEMEVVDDEEVAGEYNEGEEGQDEDAEEDEDEEVEEGGDNEGEDEDENMDSEDESEDQEEDVEDKENVEYEDEDGEEKEEDTVDEEENDEDEEDGEGGEDEEEEAMGIDVNVEPPPTPSIRRSPRVSTKARQGLNLSESDSD